MDVRAIAGAAISLLIAGCGSTSFACVDDGSCVADSSAGTCEVTGFCAFPDDDCASGRRYGELAGSVSNLCVPPNDEATGGPSLPDPTGGDPLPACGNGVAEDQEICDGPDLRGADCSSLGFASGAVQCTPDCTVDASNCTLCGNGSADPGEDCDGSPGVTCASVGLGTESEAVGCTNDCRFDYAECSACGDGMLTAPEACDPLAESPAATCESVGFDGGELGCTAGCAFDTSGCSRCGNAALESGESCDGADLGGASCGAMGFESGALLCSSSCVLDASQCQACGDGILSGTEPCDPAVPSSLACTLHGFDSGSGTCADCIFNPTGCGSCGNGAADGDEACDQLDFDGETCSSLGFAGGALACADNCTFDVSGCSGSGCGDDVIDDGEDCDGTALGANCADLGFNGGTLTCNGDCTHNTSGCTTASLVPVTVVGGGEGADNVQIGAACTNGGDSCEALGSELGWAALMNTGCTVECPEGDTVRISMTGGGYPWTDVIIVEVGPGSDYVCPNETSCSNDYAVTGPSMRFQARFFDD